MLSVKVSLAAAVYIWGATDPDMSYDAASSFIGYLVDQYGEREVIQYICSDNLYNEEWGKSYEELVQDWNEYLEALWIVQYFSSYLCCKPFFQMIQLHYKSKKRGIHMENLNDLIWTDEDDDDSVNTLGVNMRQICMIAFCQSIVGGGKSTVLVWREKELFGGYRHEKVHAETISQTEVSMAKRFVFDNLIYKINEETYLIMNLISFRRETITKEALDKLFLIESKLEAEKSLSSEEEQFLQDFYMRKQILPPEIVEKVDRQSEQNSELHLSKIPVRSVTFNLTHSCNFNCDYCYQRKYKWKSEYTRGMSTEDVKLIVEYLQLPYFDDTELEEIVVSGGEPLLPANIDTINEICERVVAKKKILFTNGTNILTYKEQIPFEAFDEVQISLDGPDAVIRQVNHYDSSFDKIIGGIKYLQHMNKKITLVTMWTKELRCHLAEYIELLKQSGILEHPDTTIKFALAIDYYSNRGLDEHFYHWDEIAADLKKYRQILSTINSNLELPVEI